MAITDTQLQELAKALAGASFDYPQYQGVGNGSISNFSVSRSNLESEIGSRVPLTITRSNNTVTFTGIRSGADVVDTTNGDTITNTGTFDLSTTSGDKLFFGTIVGGVTHTINFDIEFINSISINRV